MAERATKKTPEVIEKIVTGLSEGTPLRELCREDGMPAWRTVYDWMAADADFAAEVARARQIGYDALAEQTLGIADGTRAISEHVQLSKLRIDTRLKLLACWDPKRYGNKQTVDVGNKEGETLKVETPNVDPAVVSALTKALLTSKRDDSDADDVL